MKVIGRDREVPRSSVLKTACSPGGPASGSTACGLRLVFDRERGADLLPIDSPASLGDRTPLSEVGLPGARARGLVLTLGRRHFSPQPQGLATFHARARFQWVGGHRRERLYGAHGKEESLGVVGPEVFDSQRVGGYSPLDFPPSDGSCWAFWRQSETGGGAAYADPHPRWCTRPGNRSGTDVKSGKRMAVKPGAGGSR